MAFVLKFAPVSLKPGEAVSIRTRPTYGGAAARPGDEVFLWFSEMDGGKGLAARGLIDRVDIGAEAEICVGIRIAQASASRAFGKDDLAPFRDVRNDSAISELSRKLYKHAHHKIAALSPAEADELRGYFI